MGESNVFKEGHRNKKRHKNGKRKTRTSNDIRVMVRIYGMCVPAALSIPARGERDAKRKSGQIVDRRRLASDNKRQADDPLDLDKTGESA